MKSTKFKTKTEKGITLIALIITIVVLLILAVAAINSIQNDGIISKAEQATNKYNESVQNEAGTLQGYLDYLDKHNSNTKTYTWTQNGTSVTNGTVTLQVGETITAKSGDTTVDLPKDKDGNAIEWKVLGVEYGKLLLMSASNIGDVELEAEEGDWDNTTNSFLKQENQLHQFCKDTVTQNINYVDEIRSVKVEDINRVTGYQPTPQAPVQITYQAMIDEEYYRCWLPDGRKIEKEGDAPITLVPNYYSYSGSTELPTTEDPNSLALNSLFKEGMYWLASSCVDVFHADADFDLRGVYDGNVDSITLWNSDAGVMEDNSHGARAVVSLKSDVQVEKAS